MEDRIIVCIAKTILLAFALATGFGLCSPSYIMPTEAAHFFLVRMWVTKSPADGGYSNHVLNCVLLSPEKIGDAKNACVPRHPYTIATLFGGSSSLKITSMDVSNDANCEQ